MICAIKLNRENVFFGAKLANTPDLVSGWFIATDVDDARDRVATAGNAFLKDYFDSVSEIEPGKYRLEDTSSGQVVPYLILVTRP